METEELIKVKKKTNVIPPACVETKREKKKNKKGPQKGGALKGKPWAEDSKRGKK